MGIIIKTYLRISQTQMSKEYKSLPADAKNELVSKIMKVVKDEGVDSKIRFHATTAHVGILNAGQLQQQGGTAIKGNVGLSEQDKCNKIKEEIKKICQEADTTIPVQIECKYGVGDKVAPIEDITPLKLEDGKMVAHDNVTLKHEEG